MGPLAYKPGSATELNRCSERVFNTCDPTATDGCCAVGPCSLCVFFVAGETNSKAAAEFETDGYYGTIAGAAFRGYWERNYETDECEFNVSLDGEIVFTGTCYDLSCRDPSGSTSATIGEETGTLSWEVYEPRKLEYIVDEETNCTTEFCDSCGCSCECLCVTISELISEGVYDAHSGEICDVAYDCEPPLWEGTVGPFELSLALGRDEYARCIITATVDGIEQEPVLFPGCADAGEVTITLADTSTITVRCKKCDCDPVSPPCCGRTDLPDTLYLSITDLVNCTCNDWLGVTIPLSTTRHTQSPGTSTIWAGCYDGPCVEIGGVMVDQNVLFMLVCLAGEIGQAGAVTDFLLYKSILATDNRPCPDDLTGLISTTGTEVTVLQGESTCEPLRLVYRVVGNPDFDYLCQDAMAPPGVGEWELTVTE